MTGRPSSDAEAVPFRHRLEYGGYRFLRGILSALPLSLAVGLGDVLGWISGVVLRVRRRVVDENLACAFPHESEGWRRRTAVRSYRHLGREAVMAFRLSDATAEQVREMVEIEGLDELQRVFDEGKGVVMVTGHLGNWEIGSASLAANGLPVDAVAHRQRNRRFGEDLQENRGRLGLNVIFRDDAPRQGLRSLRAHRILGLVADQNVVAAGVFVDFFGVPAASARGPAVFALRTGAPLWYGVALRSDAPSPRYRAFVRPVEVDLDEDADPEENVLRVTRAIAEQLEETIRSAPEQYFWQHRRWKTRPPAVDGSLDATATPDDSGQAG